MGWEIINPPSFIITLLIVTGLINHDITHFWSLYQSFSVAPSGKEWAFKELLKASTAGLRKDKYFVRQLRAWRFHWILSVASLIPWSHYFPHSSLVSTPATPSSGSLWHSPHNVDHNQHDQRVRGSISHAEKSVLELFRPSFTLFVFTQYRPIPFKVLKSIKIK